MLNELIAKQRELEMTDQEFADYLRVPRSTWQLTRSGVKRPGQKVIGAAVARFPDLHDAALVFLAQNATVLTESSTESTITSTEVA